MIESAGWDLNSAAIFCAAIEAICPKYGCHVALTGGALYKQGVRKDCDILFYRIRQEDSIDIDGLIAALSVLGVRLKSEHGWVKKATFNEKGVDMFFPEDFPEKCGDYSEGGAA